MVCVAPPPAGVAGTGGHGRCAGGLEGYPPPTRYRDHILGVATRSQPRAQCRNVTPSRACRGSLSTPIPPAPAPPGLSSGTTAPTGRAYHRWGAAGTCV